MKLKKVCRILLAILCAAILAGCGRSENRKLTWEEIDQAREAFQDVIWDPEQETMTVNQLSRFFTSHYADPRNLDLTEFLWNCPVGTTLTDENAEEFQKVMEHTGVKVFYQVPSEYIVPTHRYRREDVSAVLQAYAGISVEELTSWDNVIYLEEYDAFYNFTSDYSPGWFDCTEGEIRGDTVRLWSETEMLTLKEVDGRYLIQSFQKIAD